MSEPEKLSLDQIVKDHGITYLFKHEIIPDSWISMNADRISDKWMEFMLFHGASDFVINTFGKEIRNECEKVELQNIFNHKCTEKAVTMNKVLNAAKRSLYKNDDVGVFINTGQTLRPEQNDRSFQSIKFKKNTYSFKINFNNEIITIHIYCMAGDIYFPIRIKETSEECLSDFFMLIKKLFIDTFTENTELYILTLKKTQTMMGGLYSANVDTIKRARDMEIEIEHRKKELFKTVSPIVESIHVQIENGRFKKI